MKSVMRHQFSRIPDAEIQRSSFDRSHGYKTTFDAGYLVPVFVDEVLPGDTFHLRMDAFARLATPLHPFMDNMFLDTFFFFVPYRLIWSNFKKMMGEQSSPGDSTSYTVPQVTTPTVAGGYAVGSLYDYLGLPTGIPGPGWSHSALPCRAYARIWNDWFRDENLSTPTAQAGNDGPDTDTWYVLLKRLKRHDYFTACLPWPQKGTAVPLPLTGNAPVIGIGLDSGTFSQTNKVVQETDKASTTTFPFAEAATSSTYIRGTAGTSGKPMIYADLSAVTAATINELRQSFQIQKLYERDARGGTRYIELIKSHFGVTSSDARQQRAEYLGGGSSPLNVTPVSQQSATGATGTPQGNLAAYGTVGLRGHGFSKSFEEHGIVIGLINARADLTYQQGLERFWSRSTRWDFYWPALAHIGEQAVLNKEIYLQGSTVDGGTFGYQERFAEYRYKPSRITGEFRSTFATSLDTWHLSQEFGALPTLGSTFITEDPPVDRVIAVTTEPHFLLDAYFKLHCARPMPVYSVPGLIDHF